MWNRLGNKYRLALERFVRKYKRNPNVVGILVSGSIVHSKPDKNSDLDVYIVLNKSKFRERGNTWINGVETEYFMNPINYIRGKYFKEECLGEKSPATSHMFVNSVVLYKKGRILDKLIGEAKGILRKKLPQMKRFDVEQAKYTLDDYKKDLEDTYRKKDYFAFNLIFNETLQKCLEIFYKVKRQAMPKNKRIGENLKSLDIEFLKLFENALKEEDQKSQMTIIKEVIRYIETKLGGRRAKEWKLRSRI